MNAPMLERAEQFIWANARLIDRQLFACLFAGGSKEAVLAALRAYQNPDGGFGNALEPDIRAPVSLPQPVEIAFHVLDMIDAFDDPMVGAACTYLQSITTPEGGVPFALPTLNDYPHAPWWQTAPNPPAALNPTAALAGLLLKHGVAHPWLEQAVPFCWKAIEALDGIQFHTIACVRLFLENAPDQARAGRIAQELGERILASGEVASDFSGEGYSQPPLDWAPTPQAFTRSLFSQEQIDANLHALASAQAEDGGWQITWPPVSPACETEWRGWKTIMVLRTLHAYGILETSS